MKDSIMTLSDIEEKDVINVVTGERIGFVSSLKIDTNSGQIIAITVQPSMRFVSFFSKDESGCRPMESNFENWGRCNYCECGSAIK